MKDLPAILFSTYTAVIGLTPIYASLFSRIYISKSELINKNLPSLLWLLIIVSTHALAFLAHIGSFLFSACIILILITVVCVIELHLASLDVRNVGKQWI